jgi:uncharacterized protein YlxW (UPF0749 family)
MDITDSDLYKRYKTFIEVVGIAIIAVILQVVIEPEGPWIFIICGILIALEVCGCIDSTDICVEKIVDIVDEDHSLLRESTEDLESKIEYLQSKINDLEEKISKINKRDTTYDL